MYRLEFWPAEESEPIIAAAPTFHGAVVQLLGLIQQTYHVEDRTEFCDLLWHISNLGENDSVERIDFSTPESNYEIICKED